MTHQPNLGYHQNLNKGMAKKSKKGGTPATMQHQQHQPENASPGKSGLYPKIRRKRAAPKSYYNKEELLVQYQNQKKAEVIFFNLQAQKAYVEEMIANDPRLHQYYSLWLSKANEALKDYSRVIDQPDNLSFSVRLYSKLFFFSFSYCFYHDFLISVSLRLFEGRRDQSRLQTSHLRKAIKKHVIPNV
jgi:hypothetical protein